MTFIPSQFSCNVCGAGKREANRWWIVFRRQGALLAGMPSSVEVRAWNDADARSPRAHHVCGEQCLNKLIHKYLPLLIEAAPGTAQKDDTA